MKKLVLLILCTILMLAGCQTGKTASTVETNGSTTNADGKEESYTLYKQTEHFRIFCLAQDKGCLTDLGNGFEAAYTQVTKDLDCIPDYTVDVMVYPEREVFHAAIGYTDSSGADAYVAAAAIGKQIYIVSPLNPGPARTYEHLVNGSPLHEFTHVIINDLANSDTWPENVPRWLNEGIACYEGGIPGPEDIFERELGIKVLSGTVPSFDELASYGPDFITSGGFYFTLPVGEFLVETYGFEKIRQLILAPDDYENIFGKTKQALWDEWVSYLKANHSL